MHSKDEKSIEALGYVNLDKDGWVEKYEGVNKEIRNDRKGECTGKNYK